MRCNQMRRATSSLRSRASWVSTRRARSANREKTELFGDSLGGNSFAQSDNALPRSTTVEARHSRGRVSSAAFLCTQQRIGGTMLPVRTCTGHVRFAVFVCASLSVLLTAPVARAQEPPTPRPVPIVTGYFGLATTLEPNSQTVRPTLSPILLVPAGRRTLIEAEFEMKGDAERTEGV